MSENGQHRTEGREGVQKRPKNADVLYERSLMAVSDKGSFKLNAQYLLQLVECRPFIGIGFPTIDHQLIVIVNSVLWFFHSVPTLQLELFGQDPFPDMGLCPG